MAFSRGSYIFFLGERIHGRERLTGAAGSVLLRQDPARPERPKRDPPRPATEREASEALPKVQ